MRRHLLGILALTFLGTGIALWVVPEWAEGREFWHGASIKVGLVLAAVWVAYPQLERSGSWIFSVVLALLALLILLPRMLLPALRYSWVFLPALFLLWLLRPRPPKPVGGNASGKKKRRDISLDKE